MKKLKLLLPVLITILICSSLSHSLTSCNESKHSNCDSIEIVKKYLQDHPSNNFAFNKQVSDTMIIPDTNKIFNNLIKTHAIPIWGKLKWLDVEKFMGNFDKSDLYKSIGFKGLAISNDGLKDIKKLPETVEKLNIRFGINNEGQFTVMVLPLDKNNYIDKTDDKNYDNLDPCPGSGDCPKN